MLKTLFGGLLAAALLWHIDGAQAQCTVTYPFSTGTTASATQVNQDFSDITGCALPASSGVLTGGTLAGATTLPGSGAITSSGSIGIGTASPNANLDVRGGIYFGATTGSGSHQGQLTSDGSGESVRLSAPAGMFLYGGGRSGTKLSVSQTTTCESGSLFCLNSAGSVGIGTTSPADTLEVIGSARFGSSSNPGILNVGNSNEIWTDQNINGSATIYLNYRGYQGGLTQYRNLYIGNGEGGSIAYFSGSSGYVGIGTTDPTQPLEVNGQVKVDAFASGSMTAVCENANVLSSCSSSIRFKEKVKPARFGLREVLRMRPVTFKWKGRDERDFGLIAEEVAKIDPQFVTYKDGKIEGVKYPQLAAVLINALKEQQAEIAVLTSAVRDLQARGNRHVVRDESSDARVAGH